MPIIFEVLHSCLWVYRWFGKRTNTSDNNRNKYFQTTIPLDNNPLTMNNPQTITPLDNNPPYNPQDILVIDQSLPVAFFTYFTTWKPLYLTAHRTKPLPASLTPYVDKLKLLHVIAFHYRLLKLCHLCAVSVLHKFKNSFNFPSI